MFSIKLETIKAGKFDLLQLQSNKASVLVFLSPECPMCQNYSLTLNQLSEKFKAGSVKFYGVFSGGSIDATEINAFQKTYAINFDLLTDKDKQLATLLKADVTPEVFVLDNASKIIYQGSIDNWLFELGQKRTIISEHYLDDALNAFLSGAEVRVKSTQAKGCLIE